MGRLPNITEQIELAHKAANGDTKASNELFSYAIPIMKAILHKKGVPIDRIDDAVQDACLQLIPKLKDFNGKTHFGKYAANLALWNYLNTTRSFNTKNAQQLDDSVDDGKKEHLKLIEPSYIDNTFTELQMYDRFYKEWEKLTPKEQKLFLEANEHGGKLRQRNIRCFPALLERLRSTMLTEV